MTTQLQLPPGSTIADKYVIDGLAGVGGMGAVYRAHDRDGLPVAIKLLSSPSQQLAERFTREARTLCRLRHPSIVRYLASGTTADGTPFMIMEWLDGHDLKSRLRSQRLTLAETLQLTARVANALSVAHEQGIVHRDVKPGNIFLPGGQADRAKLLDFGLARWVDGSQFITATGSAIGTPAYMAPEQVDKNSEVGPSADIFALGCVLFECLVGEPAFIGRDALTVFCKILFGEPPSARAHCPDLPIEVEHLLQRMLCHEPDERPSDGRAVADDIAYVVDRLDEGQLQQTAEQPLSRVLTDYEQRWIHVVVAGIDGATPAAESILAGDSSLELASQNTMLPPCPVPSSPTSRLLAFDTSRLRDRLRRLLGQLEAMRVRVGALCGGGLIAIIEPNELMASRTVMDQAATAARCALMIHDVYPECSVAVASGRSPVGQRQLLGEVIGRAAAMLTVLSDTWPGSEDDRPGRPGLINLDDNTCKLLGPRFEISGGSSDGYVLHGERARETEPPRAEVETPFVGRKRELSLLLGTVEEIVEEEVARAVVVTGAPGFGKTRLRREFQRLLEQFDDEVEVWLTCASSMHGDSSLALIARAVQRAAGIVESEPSAIQRYKLRERLAQTVDAENVDRVTLFLGELLKIPAADEDDVQLRAARMEPLLMGDQVRRACIDLLDAETRVAPLVLIIEDLHWGDRATVELLDRAMRRLCERPFMILALARPEIDDRFPHLWSDNNVTRLQLGRLGRRAAEKIARAALAGAAPDDRVARIVERANGNAFYIEELARNVRVGCWDLPDTVLAMVQARIASLDPRARQVLRAASIFGERFWLSGLRALLDDQFDVALWLRSLEQLELVAAAPDSRFAGDLEYTFRHGLLREGAYDMLTDDDQRLGHGLAGEWLEQVGETDGRVLAEHFERGDAPTRAVPYYVHAAEEALERSAFPAAVALAQRGVRCGAEDGWLGRLRRVQIEEQVWRGNIAEAARLCDQAIELLEPCSPAWYDVIAEAALAWGKLGSGQRVAELASSFDTSSMADSMDPACQITAAKLALQFYFSGNTARANTLLAALDKRLAQLDQVELSVAAHVHFARALRATTEMGDAVTFLHELEQCVAGFEAIGDLRNACLQRANLGYAKAEIGLYDAAEVDLRDALDIADSMELVLAANTARQTLAEVLVQRGQLDEAGEMIQRALLAFRDQGDSRMVALSLIDHAEILLLADEHDDAQSEVCQALELLSADAPLRPLALATLARVLMARRQLSEALSTASEAVALLDTLSAVESGESLVRLVYAEALYASGARPEARTAILRARELLLDRAAKIKRDDWQKSFLHNIPEHVRTLQLARVWAPASGVDHQTPIP
ncbi:MAG: protein kinase [Myxococcota bacterium]